MPICSSAAAKQAGAEHAGSYSESRKPGSQLDKSETARRWRRNACCSEHRPCCLQGSRDPHPRNLWSDENQWSGHRDVRRRRHWSILLKEIEEVKNGIEEDEEEELQDGVWDDDAARSTVTFGMPKHMTKTQLIQEMPSKEECDRLLPLWFNRYAYSESAQESCTDNCTVQILCCS